MCGIAGFINDGLLDTRKGELAHVFAKLMMETSARGTDATGAWVQNRNVWFLKGAYTATEMVRQTAYEKLMVKVNHTTTAVVGHCRAATKGMPADNRNNHPVQAGPIVLVHNGIISNSEEIVKEWTDAPTVDTAAAAYAIWQESKTVTTAGSIAKALERLKGWFSLAITDLRNPSVVYIVRHLAPMYFAYDEARKVMWFASDDVHIKKATGLTKTDAIKEDVIYCFRPGTPTMQLPVPKLTNRYTQEYTRYPQQGWMANRAGNNQVQESEVELNERLQRIHDEYYSGRYGAPAGMKYVDGKLVPNEDRLYVPPTSSVQQLIEGMPCD